ncbi:uncharacterized protein RJT20DRAFT_123488 [Scheffersomyces xylosifermentans]|uniref:uncharacterized protein n=1 Tax=Scheffersomyces xylosifermentans TaxID=1304137 RepID=UPI00315D32EB
MTVGQSQNAVLGAGIYSPVPTFFKGADFELDLDSQVKHAQMLYDSGINGVVVAGSMGESPHLTRDERAVLFKTLRNAIPDPNFKIIAGAPPSSVKDSIAETKIAKDAGADFSILLLQGYFGPNLISQEGIVDYFTAVADDSALPIIIYNYPGTSNGTEIKPETFEVLSKHPNLVAVKLTHYNMALYTLLSRNVTISETNNFRPFTGLGQILVPALSIGVYGAIDGLSGIFPKSMLKILEYYKAGEIKKSTELQYLVTKVDEMVSALNVVGVKYAIKKIHGIGEVLEGRPPLSKPVNLDTWKYYEKDFYALAEVEKSL